MGNTDSFHIAIASYHPSAEDLSQHHDLRQMMGGDFEEKVSNLFVRTTGFVMSWP